MTATGKEFETVKLSNVNFQIMRMIWCTSANALLDEAAMLEWVDFVLQPYIESATAAGVMPSTWGFIFVDRDFFLSWSRTQLLCLEGVKP